VLFNYDTDPIEPSLDAFLDVIRSMLESPDTTENTRNVAISVLEYATIHRLLLNYVGYYD